MSRAAVADQHLHIHMRARRPDFDRNNGHLRSSDSCSCLLLLLLLPTTPTTTTTCTTIATATTTTSTSAPTITIASNTIDGHLRHSFNVQINNSLNIILLCPSGNIFCTLRIVGLFSLQGRIAVENATPPPPPPMVFGVVGLTRT